jgi:hypothetical protein
MRYHQFLRETHSKLENEFVARVGLQNYCNKKQNMALVAKKKLISLF